MYWHNYSICVCFLSGTRPIIHWNPRATVLHVNYKIHLTVLSNKREKIRKFRRGINLNLRYVLSQIFFKKFSQTLKFLRINLNRIWAQLSVLFYVFKGQMNIRYSAMIPESETIEGIFLALLQLCYLIRGNLSDLFDGMIQNERVRLQIQRIGAALDVYACAPSIFAELLSPWLSRLFHNLLRRNWEGDKRP